MQKIIFKFLTSENINEWNKYIIKSPNSSYVHHSAWEKTVVDAYNHKSNYLIAYCDNRVVGSLPLFLVTIPFIGKVLSSGIYGTYGGICSDNDEVTSSLINESENLAHSMGVKYLEIKNLNNYTLPKSKWDKYLDYYTMVLNLDYDIDEIWKKITKKARQNIRKAINSDVKIVSGHQYFKVFYDLIAYKMKMLGTPVHSKKFYKSILDNFKEDAELYIAQQNGKTISVALTIRFGNKIFGLANAAHEDYLIYKPNFLIYWEIIKAVTGSNIKFFDLGRSLINSGTYTFKENFGAYPVPLFYDYYLNKIKTLPVMNQGNKKLHFATNIWSHLPLNVTKIIGPHLIKYVV